MKEWKVSEIDRESRELAESLGLPEVIPGLLRGRRLETPDSVKKFLYPERKDIYSPSLLPDLDKAVKVISRAVEKKEKILLFGDYDVDGITSLSILGGYLSKRKAVFKTVIPSRIKEGYGFNQKALETAEEENVSLIIVLDCGTNSSLLDKAVKSGIDVIVVDHHEVLKAEREYLLINPKRKDCSYPFKGLPAGALAFKLVWGLKNMFPYEYLDLAGLSIVCDVAPLIDENRCLLKEGLDKFRNSPCLGINCLMEASSVRREYLEAFHLGWILGPRLNASGRMGSAYPALELLSAEDEDKAKELALFLDKNNRKRQAESRRLFEEASAELNSSAFFQDDSAVVLSGEGWHPGILGIAASQLKEKVSKPVFLISLRNGEGRGSGRSIDGLDIMEALDYCKDLLIGYGGHKKACGIEIKSVNVSAFREKLNSFVKENLKGKRLQPSLFIDFEIEFKDITSKLLDYLNMFSPFGEGNPEPVFLSRDLSIKGVSSLPWGGKTVWLEQKGPNNERVVYPAQVKPSNKLCEFVDYSEPVDVVYSLRKNKSAQASQCVLKVKDVRLSQ